MNGGAGGEDALVLPGAKTSLVPSCAEARAEIQLPLRRKLVMITGMP